MKKQFGNVEEEMKNKNQDINVEIEMRVASSEVTRAREAVNRANDYLRERELILHAIVCKYLCVKNGLNTHASDEKE